MANTLNLLPIRTKDQIKKELTRYKYDLYTALIILAVVVGGVICMFAHAFLQYNISNLEGSIRTGTNNLQTYKPLAEGFFVVDRKVTQIKLVKASAVNPSDVVTYLEGLIPQGTGLSNFTLTADKTFTVTISSGNYLDIAKFLVVLENQNLKVKNTEIKQIDYNHDQNVVNFVISGVYSK